MSLAEDMVRVILDNSPKEPTALMRALEASGVKVVRGVWEPDGALLERTDACFVSLYDCLKHPARVWRLKQALRRRGVPLVTWNIDAPGYMNKAPWRLALLERAGLIDIYAAHSLADGRRFARTQLLLQNAARVEHYNLGGASLAVELGAVSADHLVKTSEATSKLGSSSPRSSTPSPTSTSPSRIR